MLFKNLTVDSIRTFIAFIVILMFSNNIIKSILYTLIFKKRLTSHSVLNAILVSMGFKDPVLSWTVSYLNSSEQRVRIGGLYLAPIANVLRRSSEIPPRAYLQFLLMIFRTVRNIVDFYYLPTTVRFFK